jgi:hypothetical protein
MLYHISYTSLDGIVNGICYCIPLITPLLLPARVLAALVVSSMMCCGHLVCYGLLEHGLSALSVGVLITERITDETSVTGVFFAYRRIKSNF